MLQTPTLHQPSLLRHIATGLVAGVTTFALMAPMPVQAQGGLSATVTTEQAGGEPTSTEGKLTEGQRQAALEMIEIMGMDDTLDLSMRQMIDVQVQRNPQLAPMRDVLEDFFETYLSWEQLKGDFVRLYARTFTEEEMREITTFYRTPTGQKMLEALPGLIAESNGIGMSRVQAHYGELQQALAERQEQLKAQADAAAAIPAAEGTVRGEGSEDGETPPN